MFSGDIVPTQAKVAIAGAANSNVALVCCHGSPSTHQANSSAPAGVKVTKVPDSCILSQPRSIASLRPAPYSAGVCTENLIRVDAVMESRKLTE